MFLKGSGEPPDLQKVPREVFGLSSGVATAPLGVPGRRAPHHSGHCGRLVGSIWDQLERFQCTISHDFRDAIVRLHVVSFLNLVRIFVRTLEENFSSTATNFTWVTVGAYLSF